MLKMKFSFQMKAGMTMQNCEKGGKVCEVEKLEYY